MNFATEQKLRAGIRNILDSRGLDTIEVLSPEQINEMDIEIKSLKEELKRVKLDTIEYCKNYHTYMWSSKVMGLVLNCDFKDAKREGTRFIMENPRSVCDNKF